MQVSFLLNQTTQAVSTLDKRKEPVLTRLWNVLEPLSSM